MDVGVEYESMPLLPDVVAYLCVEFPDRHRIHADPEYVYSFSSLSPKLLLYLLEAGFPRVFASELRSGLYFLFRLQSLQTSKGPHEFLRLPGKIYVFSERFQGRERARHYGFARS